MPNIHSNDVWHRGSDIDTPLNETLSSAQQCLCVLDVVFSEIFEEQPQHGAITGAEFGSYYTTTTAGQVLFVDDIYDEILLLLLRLKLFTPSYFNNNCLEPKCAQKTR